MKNIEKYPNTVDALEAWNDYHANCNENVGFVLWLGLDYDEPLSLPEATKSASDQVKENHNERIVAYYKRAQVIAREKIDAIFRLADNFNRNMK